MGTVPKLTRREFGLMVLGGVTVVGVGVATVEAVQTMPPMWGAHALPAGLVFVETGGDEYYAELLEDGSFRSMMIRPTHD